MIYCILYKVNIIDDTIDEDTRQIMTDSGARTIDDYRLYCVLFQSILFQYRHIS
jgi:hypothetical protein